MLKEEHDFTSINASPLPWIFNQTLPNLLLSFHTSSPAWLCSLPEPIQRKESSRYLFQSPLLKRWAHSTVWIGQIQVLQLLSHLELIEVFSKISQRNEVRNLKWQSGTIGNSAYFDYLSRSRLRLHLVAVFHSLRQGNLNTVCYLQDGEYCDQNDS